MIWIWYFLFYSALGFGLEVLYTWMTRGSKKDRKCLLFLPLCPVYGLGAVGILLLPEGVTQRPGLLLLAAGCIATGAEYLLGWFYQRFWRVSFWDYSALPFHLHGRVCLPFALAWGLLNFVMLMLEKYGGLGRRWPVFFRWLFTFLVFLLTAVFFRADSLAHALTYFQSMLGFGAGWGDGLTVLYLSECWLPLLCAALFSAPVAPKLRAWANRRGWLVLDVGYALLIAGVFLVSACFIIKGTYNPFIYFNF